MVRTQKGGLLIVEMAAGAAGKRKIGRPRSSWNDAVAWNIMVNQLQWKRETPDGLDPHA